MENNKNDWEILSEKVVYDNAWISLVHHEVINPSGNPGIYGKVHFKNIAIGILPLEEDDTLHLIGQYRFVLQQYSIEIPEGGGSLADDPLLAAKRELLEETGLTAERWDKILEMHMSNSVTDEYCIVYLARSLSQGKALPEETEKLDHIKLPFDAAYQMVIENKITDAISVAAILKLRLMQMEGKI
jgi:8-oxo-dGTP pyrophosphatase MutT (NUDIX family)